MSCQTLNPEYGHGTVRTGSGTVRLLCTVTSLVSAANTVDVRINRLHVRFVVYTVL